MNASAFIALLTTTCVLCSAYSQDQVLTGDKLTERALIDALTGESPVDRGFKPAAPLASDTAQPPKAGKASLLLTFSTASAQLTAATTQQLDLLASALKSNELRGSSFVVEGHADPRGGDVYNQRLSLLRAQAVVSYLIEKHGMPSTSLRAVGKGASELLDINQPLAPQNRRVTIVTVR